MHIQSRSLIVKVKSAHRVMGGAGRVWAYGIKAGSIPARNHAIGKASKTVAVAG